jgi:NADPH:quinone reductase-like Zn-dependent oxidoreductase
VANHSIPVYPGDRLCRTDRRRKWTFGVGGRSRCVCPHWAWYVSVLIECRSTEVLGYLDPFKKLRTGQGALAEYLKISVRFPQRFYLIHSDNLFQSSLLFTKPTTIPYSEAAGLPIAGLTAYEGIVTRGHVAPGQRIFVNGGSSAIGAMAVQIGKGRGAVVVTTCSGGKREFVEGLGADLVSASSVTLWYLLMREALGS